MSSVADLPAPDPKNECLWKNFFGKERAFSSGINRLSQKSDSKVIPYVCYFEEGRYIMKFADLEEDIYSFFEKEIIKKPGMWWANDLLETYTVKEKATCEL